MQSSTPRNACYLRLRCLRLRQTHLRLRARSYASLMAQIHLCMIKNRSRNYLRFSNSDSEATLQKPFASIQNHLRFRIFTWFRKCFRWFRIFLGFRNCEFETSTIQIPQDPQVNHSEPIEFRAIQKHMWLIGRKTYCDSETASFQTLNCSNSKAQRPRNYSTVCETVVIMARAKTQTHEHWSLLISNFRNHEKPTPHGSVIFIVILEFHPHGFDIYYNIYIFV